MQSHDKASCCCIMFLSCESTNGEMQTVTIGKRLCNSPNVRFSKEKLVLTAAPAHSANMTTRNVSPLSCYLIYFGKRNMTFVIRNGLEGNS